MGGPAHAYDDEEEEESLAAGEKLAYNSEWQPFRAPSCEQGGLHVSDMQRLCRSTKDSPLTGRTTAASEPPASPCLPMSSTTSPHKPPGLVSATDRSPNLMEAQECVGLRTSSPAFCPSAPQPVCLTPGTTAPTAVGHRPGSYKEGGGFICSEWQTEVRVHCPSLSPDDDAQVFANELERSLVQVRLAAEENFAISKASMYQRMVQEFRADRELYLLRLKETTAEAEAARRELGAMRVCKEAAEDRLSHLLAYMCRRFLRHDARERKIAAWRAWLVFWECRKARRMPRKLADRLRSERLVLRCFHPWYAASLRATAERMQQRAVQAAQHETERLRRVAAEDRQTQARLLLEVRQKLHEETQYRELLQRNIQLILLKGATAICLPQQGIASARHMPFSRAVAGEGAALAAGASATKPDGAASPGLVKARRGLFRTPEVLLEAAAPFGGPLGIGVDSRLGRTVPHLVGSAICLTTEPAGTPCTFQSSLSGAEPEPPQASSSPSEHHLLESSSLHLGGQATHPASTERYRGKTEMPRRPSCPGRSPRRAPPVVGHSAPRIRLPSGSEAAGVAGGTCRSSAAATRFQRHEATCPPGDFSSPQVAHEKATSDPLALKPPRYVSTSPPVSARPATKQAAGDPRRPVHHFQQGIHSRCGSEITVIRQGHTDTGRQPNNVNTGLRARLVYPGGVHRKPPSMCAKGAWPGSSRRRNDKTRGTAVRTWRESSCSRLDGFAGTCPARQALWHKEARWTRSASSTEPRSSLLCPATRPSPVWQSTAS